MNQNNKNMSIQDIKKIIEQKLITEKDLSEDKIKNLNIALSIIKGIMDDFEFCHNESFSYRYQVPNFDMISFVRGRAENSIVELHSFLDKHSLK